MENINANASEHEVILTGPNGEDVTGYFLAEPSGGEDMTSDILTLALREASQETCNNNMENITNNYNPMEGLSVSIALPRNSDINEQNTNNVQEKFDDLSHRISCNSDFTAVLTQCENSQAILNSNSCYFTTESQEVASSECNNAGNSLSIGIEQLVNSLSNFDSNQLEKGQNLESQLRNGDGSDDMTKRRNDVGLPKSKMEDENELQDEKYFESPLPAQMAKDGGETLPSGQVDISSVMSGPIELVPLTEVPAIELVPLPAMPSIELVPLSRKNTQTIAIKNNKTTASSSVSVVPKAIYETSNSTAKTTPEPIMISSEIRKKTLIPIKAAQSSVNVDHVIPPLGSSNNPIQVIQNGNTYHSTQALTNEQLQQIAMVLQQQQEPAMKTVENKGAVLYNPDTNTRIIYRVVYPANNKQLETKENGKAVTITKSRGRPRKTWAKKPEPETPRVDGQELSKEEKDEKKKHRPRTRYGRISKPPSYMIKDYKRIHHLDFDHEPYDDSDGGYSDFQQSEDEGGSTSEQCPRSTDCAAAVGKENKRTLPPGVTTIKPRNYKCATCDKAYIGKGGLERHFRLAPNHGSIEDFEDNAQEVFSDENSNTSSTSQETRKANKLSNNDVNSDNINHNAQSNITKDAKKSRAYSRFSSGYYARRKAKLKEVIQPYQDDELLELLLPRLSKLVNLWDFLLLKSETGDPAEPDIPDIFKQFEELVERLQTVAKDCLVLSPLSGDDDNCATSSQERKLYFELGNEKVASALGITVGIYEVKQKELLELVPSFVKPNLKRKTNDRISSETANSAFSNDISKKICQKNLSDSALAEDDTNNSQRMNFMTSTSIMAESRDSLGNLSIPDTILTHSVPMMDENGFHLDQIRENIRNSNMTSDLNEKNGGLPISANDSTLTTEVNLTDNRDSKTLNRNLSLNNNRNVTETKNHLNNALMNKSPSMNNVSVPSLSLESSLLFGNMSLSPSSLTTDLKSSSNLFHVKKDNLFGNSDDRDNFLNLENSQDSLSDSISKDNNGKHDGLANSFTLSRIQDRPTGLLDVPHSHSHSHSQNESDISKNVSGMIQSSNETERCISKPDNSNMASYIISQNETPCLFSQNESEDITLFKGDSQTTDPGNSMLMDFNSKSSEISHNDFHEMVVGFENEPREANASSSSCLVGLLVNSNEDKMKEGLQGGDTLTHMDLDDMSEDVTKMFDNKRSSGNDIPKNDEIENSFLPGNVIIVQNPDGTTTLQVPGNQVFSIEALQALFGFEQPSPLNSSSENLGNSITLNSQLSDISTSDNVLMDNMNS